MTVLVTGASGFVGGALARRLLGDGRSVRVLVRDPEASGVRDLRGAGADVVRGDLRSSASLRAACDGTVAVFHAAAHLGDAGGPEPYRAVNVVGTRALLAASEAAGTVRRFVFVSSPSALMAPDGGDLLGIDESVPYPRQYFNHYCATKAAAEKVVLHHHSAMSCCALRPRAVWGPGDHRGPIAVVLDRLARRRVPDLDPGRPVLASLCHIDNLTAAAVAAIDAPAEIVSGRAYFLADADPVDIWPMLRELARTFGLPAPGRRLPLPVATMAAVVAEQIWRLPVLNDRRTPPISRYTLALLTRSATYDTAAACRDLGYRPTVGVDDGLAGYRDWVQSVGGVSRLAAAQ